MYRLSIVGRSAIPRNAPSTTARKCSTTSILVQPWRGKTTRFGEVMRIFSPPTSTSTSSLATGSASHLVRVRPAQGLAVDDHEPAVVGFGPAQPRPGDGREVLRRRQPPVPGPAGEVGFGRPLRPQRPPPPAILRRGVAPDRGRGHDLLEPRRFRPPDQPPAGIGLGPGG